MRKPLKIVIFFFFFCGPRTPKLIFSLRQVHFETLQSFTLANIEHFFHFKQDPMQYQGIIFIISITIVVIIDIIIIIIII